MKIVKKQDVTYAKGRRRVASARVRLMKGKGESMVNNLPISKYFPGKVMEKIWKKPFTLTETWEKYFVTVRVVGGGKIGQLEAVVHGISRSLSIENKEKNRTTLKKAGLLTKDDRARERRKVGMGGKSRRKKQSPKR